jgi:hypothetical protein
LAGIPLNRVSSPDPEATDTISVEAPAEEASFRGRFFYGWVIVAVMAVTGGLTMCMGALNFGRLAPPIGSHRYWLPAAAGRGGPEYPS